MVRMNHKIYQVTLDINDDSDSFYWFLMGPINQASPCVSTHSERLIENKHEYWIVWIEKSKKKTKNTSWNLAPETPFLAPPFDGLISVRYFFDGSQRSVIFLFHMETIAREILWLFPCQQIPVCWITQFPFNFPLWPNFCIKSLPKEDIDEDDNFQINWQFYSWVKQCNITSRDIDTSVSDLLALSLAVVALCLIERKGNIIKDIKL